MLLVWPPFELVGVDTLCLWWVVERKTRGVSMGNGVALLVLH